MPWDVPHDCKTSRRGMAHITTYALSSFRSVRIVRIDMPDNSCGTLKISTKVDKGIFRLTGDDGALVARMACVHPAGLHRPSEEAFAPTKTRV